MSTFKVGFIGAGGIARHQIGILKKMGGVEVTAASDPGEGPLKTASDTYGVLYTYSDFRTMLQERTDLDAVSVCTPNSMHAEASIAALEAGKHVLVEKPMAMNAAEAQRMVDAARAAKKELVVGFQYRFEPQSQMIRKQVEGGEFGTVMYVRCQALRRRGIPNWGVFGRKDLQGGGPMIDIGVHVLEMAHYMMGSPKPVAAFANAWTFHGNKPSDVVSTWPNWDHTNYTVEDMACGMIRFDNGAMLAIEASFVAHIEQDIWNVNLLGEKGGANWEKKEIFKDHNGYMMNMTPNYLGNWTAWDEKMRHFVEVCRGNRENDSTGEQGLMVQKMLDGIYASAADRKEALIT